MPLCNLTRREHMSSKERVQNLERSSNPHQRIVIGIVAPIVMIFLGYGVMTIIDSNRHELWRFDPSELGESWWGWAVVFGAIGVLEWRLFASRFKLTTIDDQKSSHVFSEDLTTGEAGYRGSYIKSADGKGGRAVFGKDATALTVIQIFLMHIADMAPQSTKRAFCDWANISPTQWTAHHRDLFANAFLHYLQEVRQQGWKLPTEYEVLMPDLMKQELPPLPQPLTPQFREEIQAILFGR